MQRTASSHLCSLGLWCPKDHPTWEQFQEKHKCSQKQREDGQWFGQVVAYRSCLKSFASSTSQLWRAGAAVPTPGMDAQLVPSSDRTAPTWPHLTSKLLGRVVQVPSCRLHHTPVIHQPAGQSMEQSLRRGSSKVRASKAANTHWLQSIQTHVFCVLPLCTLPIFSTMLSSSSHSSAPALNASHCSLFTTAPQVILMGFSLWPLWANTAAQH